MSVEVEVEMEVEVLSDVWGPGGLFRFLSCDLYGEIFLRMCIYTRTLYALVMQYWMPGCFSSPTSFFLSFFLCLLLTAYDICFLRGGDGAGVMV